MPLYSTKETIDAVIALLRGETNDKIAALPTAAGKSAYDIAVAAGFTGTQQQWLDSLKGTPGAPGISGLQFAGIYKNGDVIPDGPVGTAYLLEVPSSDAKLNGFALVTPANSTAAIIGLPSGSKAGMTLVLGTAYAPGSSADYAFVPAGAAQLATSSFGTTSRQEWTTLTLAQSHIDDTRSGLYPNGCVQLAPNFATAQRIAAVAGVFVQAGTPLVTISQVTSAGSAAPYTAPAPGVTPPRRSLVFHVITKRSTGATFAGVTQPAGTALVGTSTVGTSAGGETAIAVAQWVPVQLGGAAIPAGTWGLPASAANFFSTTVVVPVAL